MVIKTWFRKVLAGPIQLKNKVRKPLKSQVLQLLPLEQRLNPSFTGIAGSGLPFDNVTPVLGMTYLVALQGVFPTAGSSWGGNLDSNTPYLGEISLFAGDLPGNDVPAGWATAEG